MTRDLSAAIAAPAAPAAPYAVPERLAGWIPFIRVADSQRYPAGKIAEALSAQGVKASPDDVRHILTAYKGKRHAVPVATQLDSAAAAPRSPRYRAGALSSEPHNQTAKLHEIKTPSY